MSSNLNYLHRWILFYVFIIAFVVITGLTIWGIFFGLENFDENYKKVLFGTLIIELIGVVILLFRSGFFSEKPEIKPKKIWIDFGVDDVREFIGCEVFISPRGADGNLLGGEIVNKIQKDKGLYVSPRLPSSTISVFITLEINNKVFDGSFSVQSYSVMLEGEDI